jgi:hypothetical protein
MSLYIRKLSVFLIFNFIYIYGYSQTVLSPVIEYVTVNHATKTPEVYWSYSDPLSIDGYSIIRLIYSHPLAAPNTYQTIYSTDNPFINSYEDVSGSFGPALPYERIEKYKVIAFDINGSDTLYSIPSDIHQTVFLQTSYEFCDKTIKLIWNRYIGWGENFIGYDIYCKQGLNDYIKIGNTLENGDTIFYDTNVIPQTEYQYYVKAISINGFGSNSNESEINTETPDIPLYLNSDSIIVDLDNSIRLFFNIDNQSDVESFSLFKCDNSSSNYYSILDISDNSQTITLFDNGFDYSLTNSYYLQALDYCGNSLIGSDTVSNIALVLKKLGDENVLNWRSSELFDIYMVFRILDGELSLISNTQSETFSDNTNELFYNQFNGEITSGRFCYYIEGYKNNYKSRSNTSCIDRDPVYYFPNAFNPKSSIEENRTFKPKIAYITDYQIIIYDNYGSKVYESNDPISGWDGKFATGKLAPASSYIYYTSFKNAIGEKIVLKGVVCLVYQ